MNALVYAVYTWGLGLLLLAWAPLALWRRTAHGVPIRLRERLGLYRDRPGDRPAAWVHAVSVGETLAAVPIVEELSRLHPELPIVVTTVTATGARVARQRLARAAIHRYFPLDLPGAVRRAIAHNRPRFVVVLETELWPNLFRALAAAGVPLMIANGRISDRSYRRYRLARGFMRRLLESVAVFGMRSAEDARRIIALGAAPERVFVTGNVKNDAAAPDGNAPALWRRLLGLGPGAVVWIAGSTHRGEEATVLDVHARLRERHPGLVLVLAPRHPERAAEVERLVQARGLPAVRRSALPGARADGATIVLDTVGELAPLYEVADVVFVGGSLVPLGGHNMVEVALRRKPSLFGPHTENFRESAELLAGSGGGLVVRDAAELERAMTRLLGDPALRAAMGAAGFAAVAARQGAVRETLTLIERFLIEPGAVRE
jgi:3-deoxy-D-manno-octulosonic-acid transferase